MPTLLGRKHADIDSGFTLEKKGQFYIRRKQFSECFHVLADNIGQFENEIVSTAGLPALGDIVDGGYLLSKKATEVASVVHPVSGVWTTLWEVTCAYDSQLDENQANQANQDDPTALRPKRRWYSIEEEERLAYDPVTLEPIQTQAGEPIIVMHPVTRPMLEIERIEPYPFDPDVILHYTNKTNTKTFYGAKPGCACIRFIEADEETINGELYVRVKYTIMFKIIRVEVDDAALLFGKVRDTKTFGGKTFVDIEGGFLLSLLHEGYQYLPRAKVTVTGPLTTVDADDPVPHPIINRDKDGNPLKTNLYTDHVTGRGRVRGENTRGGTKLTAEDEVAGEHLKWITFNRLVPTDFDPLSLQY